MSKRIVTLLLALVAMPAIAQDISYTYIERVPSFVNGTMDGPSVRGSIDLGSGLYAIGRHAQLQDTYFRLEPWEAGVGYRHTIADRFDLFGEAAYNRVDTPFGDQEGHRAGLGVRSPLAEGWEGLARVDYINGGDFDERFSGTVGLLYSFDEHWSLVSEARFDEGGVRAVLAGARFRF